MRLMIASRCKKSSDQRTRRAGRRDGYTQGRFSGEAERVDAFDADFFNSALRLQDLLDLGYEVVARHRLRVVGLPFAHQCGLHMRRHDFEARRSSGCR